VFTDLLIGGDIMRVIVVAIVTFALMVQACGHPTPAPNKEPLKPGEKTAGQPG